MDNMRFLINGLKSKPTIDIDLSQASSDIEDSNQVQVIKPVPKNPIKFCPITPIRKLITKNKKPVHVVNNGRRGKVEEQAEVISDGCDSYSDDYNFWNERKDRNNKNERNDRNLREEQEEKIRINVMNNEENMHIAEYNQPKKVFKKRLVKVSNKCKIQRKQYSTSQCSICLGSLQSKTEHQIGRLQCKHIFCYQCILKSSTFSSKCPYCRSSFEYITRNGQLIPVQYKQLQEDFDPYEEPCYICGRNDDFDHLLECQYCQAAFCHTYCDQRLESQVPPQESWYCLSCSSLLGH